jgi:Flp pilus assembly protein TadB
MTTGLIFLSGILLTGGVVLVIAGLVPATPHLGDTLARLYRPIGFETERRDRTSARRIDPRSELSASMSQRLGGWLYRRTPVPLTAGQQRALQIRGRSVTEFFADKAVWAVIGFTLPPLLAGFVALVAGGVAITVPVLAALLGAIAGYFVPDLLLRGQARATGSDASAALLMYIDLVTLERLANASATQSLHNAAQLSDVPLFRQLRAALERARLEQQAPYTELRRLADELDLAELRDLADVMQLDESGAALSGSLRARARELRDAHLATTLREANSASEGMTIYMTIPALLFAVMFLVPALMRIVMS